MSESLRSDQLPEFDRPPVVETVLGAQFEGLPDLSPPLVGWFWRQHLPGQWPVARLANPIADQVERFDELKWQKHVLELKLVPPQSAWRVQIESADEQRLVQVQNTRFHFNWRKRNGDYPSFRKLLPEFKERFFQFCDFIKTNQGREPRVTQWEITYVNHILKDDLWNSPADWATVVPNFFIPLQYAGDQVFDGFDGEWHKVLGDKLGRIHISLKHAKIGAPDGPEALVLQLTARGPIKPTLSLVDGLEIGHNAIVNTFAGMTSESAHKIWKRRQ